MVITVAETLERVGATLSALSTFTVITKEFSVSIASHCPEVGMLSCQTIESL